MPTVEIFIISVITTTIIITIESRHRNSFPNYNSTIHMYSDVVRPTTVRFAAVRSRSFVSLRVPVLSEFPQFRRSPTRRANRPPSRNSASFSSASRTRCDRAPSSSSTASLCRRFTGRKSLLHRFCARKPLHHHFRPLRRRRVHGDPRSTLTRVVLYAVASRSARRTATLAVDRAPRHGQ